jgi:putative ABC transport system ATP-binding protein
MSRPGTWTPYDRGDPATFSSALNNEGRTIILVTHEDEVSKLAKRVIRLKDGRLQWDRTNSQEVRDEAAAMRLENMPVEV